MFCPNCGKNRDVININGDEWECEFCDTQFRLQWL